MRSLLFMFFLLIPTLAMASDTNSKPNVEMSEEYFSDKSEDALSSWMIYGFALTKWQVKYTETGLVDYFDRECFARKFMLDARIFSKKEKSAEPDEDLDALEKIYDAGFLKEYIALYIAADSWVIPKDLNLIKFRIWADKNLVKHKPVRDVVRVSNQ